MNYYAGIDTSCYTTSFALVCKDEVVADKRIMLKVPKGKRGLRQSDAVFQHIQNLNYIFSRLKLQKPIKAVGVSNAPRKVEGSYMPVFTAGMCAARVLSAGAGAVYKEFSHQDGHIAAGLYSANAMHLYKKEFLAFHISGGTTELLLVKNGKIKIIGGSLDISAGQLIDRVGVLLGLDFPCGKEMERLALNSSNNIEIKPSVKDLSINFSGAETKLIHQLKGKKEDIAAATINCITESIVKVIENAKRKYGINDVLMVGGVAANLQLRKRLEGKAYFADPALSTDNAVGIALLAQQSEDGGSGL